MRFSNIGSFIDFHEAGILVFWSQIQNKFEFESGWVRIIIPATEWSAESGLSFL